MRTTLQLDDDLYRAAKALAESRGVPLGVVISELALRGMSAAAEPRERAGFPVFPVPRGAPPITPESVQQALADE